VSRAISWDCSIYSHESWRARPCYCSCHPTVQELDVPCPVCNQTALSLQTLLRAKPLGSFSLSGQQLKFSAYEWPHLVCGECGAAFPAKKDDGMG
jgi:hypothetical protein